MITEKQELLVREVIRVANLIVNHDEGNLFHLLFDLDTALKDLYYNGDNFYGEKGGE